MAKQFMLEKTFDVQTTIEIVETDGKYYAEVNRNFDDLWEEDDEYAVSYTHLTLPTTSRV